MARYVRKISEEVWEDISSNLPTLPSPKLSTPLPSIVIISNRAKRIQWQKVESSAITHLAYEEPDTSEGRLWVRFISGVVYYYIGVPKELYQAGLAAESVGRWWNHHVKGQYECFNPLGSPVAV